MIYRTLDEAYSERSHASWKDVLRVKVTLKDGRTFYRTSTFDHYQHRCKRCRKANQRGRIRCAHAVGNQPCTICGNPYAHFTRQSRAFRDGKWITLEQCYGSGGNLH